MSIYQAELDKGHTHMDYYVKIEAELAEDNMSRPRIIKIIKLEFILRLKIKRNDWLLADTCPQAANHCALF